eukprot:COSAG03_NODE_839_length_5667_cov_7.035022_4_plen_176_part_00
MQCKQMMTDLPYHRLTVELCHLKKLCKTCATAEAPNACSHAMWQRAWTTTKKQLEETGGFDKDWANTDERYLHAREEARQLALQRAQAAQPAAAAGGLQPLPRCHLPQMVEEEEDSCVLDGVFSAAAAGAAPPCVLPRAAWCRERIPAPPCSSTHLRALSCAQPAVYPWSLRIRP